MIRLSCLVAFCHIYELPKRTNMNKNLIKKYMSAIGIIFSMAYLSACSNNDYAQVAEQQQNMEMPVKEEVTEFALDVDAPEGTLKTYFFVSSEKIIPENFTENVSDESEFVEGFRNVKLLCDDPTNFELSIPEWSMETDCYEENNVSADTLQASVLPEKDGLYSMEIVGTDIYGNASVAKVYVLYLTEPGKPQWLKEQPVQEAQTENVKNGFDRAKAEEAFAAVNQQRTANGLHELVWNESLYELACIRAQEIVMNFSHQRPDGSYVGDVIIRQYGAGGCGENIAENYRSVTNLVGGWMNSQGHKENILNERFTSGVMACYCHEGNYYWVNLFQQ